MILPDTLIFHLDRDFTNLTYDHVRVITAAVVPEPSSLAMLAIGALTLGVGQRRCRRRRASGQ